MKKIASTLIVVVFTLTLLALSAQAQNRVLGRADVPFAFSAQGTQFASGNYEVRLIGNGLVRLRHVASGNETLLIFPMGDARGTEPKLTFHRYGASAYLAGISSPVCSCAMELPESRAEREQRSESPRGQRTVLAVVLK